jgi:peptide/nickel transport system substrate-binding protein/oligopeptide transport system substrate-binding protein
MQGADANTLIIKTQKPAPYLPAMLLYSLPLSAAALATTGPLYNTKPETAVSSGPVHPRRVAAGPADHLRS